MNKVLCLLLLCLSSGGYAQQFVVSGFVGDGATQERLPGVNIFESTKRKGAVSNPFGFYSLAIPAGDTAQIRFSFIGYRHKVISLCLASDTTLNIALEPGVELEEVTVKGQRARAASPEIGLLSITVNQIKQLPAIMGESDVLRAFQLMPGVQGGKEGTSGIHVRGGSPDQNLIMLDDIPLYYVNHIGGFVSVFNPDALKSVELFKGGFPARYGGRLSGVMDVRMKEGNMTELSGNYTIGILSSKFSIEGPLKKNKTSFMISARRSLFDLLTHAYYKLTNSDFTAGYSLFDYNAKINHVVNSKNRLYLSLYTGRDQILAISNLNDALHDHPYYYKGKNDLNWGNLNYSMRWNRVYSTKLFSNTTIGYTRFYYNALSEAKRFDKQTKKNAGHLYSLYASRIDDFIAKTDMDYYHKVYHMKFGGGITRHKFTPTMQKVKRLEAATQNADTTYGGPTTNALSFFVYAENTLHLTEAFKLNAGVHFAGFSESGWSHLSLQPRLMVSYALTKGFSVHFSYTEMVQPVHLLSNNEAGLPADLWVPASKEVPPQKSSLIALGASGESNKITHLNWSIEAFYKTFNQLIEFSENASFFTGSADWKDKIEKNGTGAAYGIELLLQKKQGQTTGWIAYSFSYNNRQFQNLNFGKPFPYKYDRRHDFSITINHKLAKNKELAATWVFSSGQPISLPNTGYSLLAMEHTDRNNPNNWGDIMYHYNNEVHIYGYRNNYRMPHYHRLDISMHFNKQLRKGLRTWTLGVYNAYNHHNPYYLYFKANKNGDRKLHSFSLFPIIPSFSYSYSF